MNTAVKKFIKEHKYDLIENRYVKIFEDALDRLPLMCIKLLLNYFEDGGLEITESKRKQIIMRGVMREELPEMDRSAYWLSYFVEGNWIKGTTQEWVEAIKNDPWFHMWYTDAGINGEPDYVVLCENVPLGSFVNFINNLQTGVQYYADEFEKVT